MTDFWQELARSTMTEQKFDTDRQRAFQAAVANAKALYNEIMQRPEELQRYGVTVEHRERLVSFKKNDREILAVTFGTDSREKNRIFSPVIEYLKLDPSYEDFSARDNVSQRVARWLARSLEAIRQNSDALNILGIM